MSQQAICQCGSDVGTYHYRHRSWSEFRSSGVWPHDKGNAGNGRSTDQACEGGGSVGDHDIDVCHVFGMGDSGITGHPVGIEHHKAFTPVVAEKYAGNSLTEFGAGVQGELHEVGPSTSSSHVPEGGSGSGLSSSNLRTATVATATVAVTITGISRFMVETIPVDRSPLTVGPDADALGLTGTDVGYCSNTPRVRPEFRHRAKSGEIPALSRNCDPPREVARSPRCR